jgi:parallel beta-helix repeat protein
MATEKIWSIKASGGDFTSIAAAIASQSVYDRDYITNNEICVLEISGYWTAVDSASVDLDGFSYIDEDHWVEIRAVGDARHSGVYDEPAGSNSPYCLKVTGEYCAINIAEGYVRIYGLQIGFYVEDEGVAVDTYDAPQYSDIRIAKNILNCCDDDPVTSYIDLIELWEDVDKYIYVWNNLFLDCNVSGDSSGIYISSSQCCIYNNTVYGCQNGIYIDGCEPVLKNNLVQGTPAGGYSFCLSGSVFPGESSLHNIGEGATQDELSQICWGATWAMGTTNGTGTNKLIDTTKTFITDGVVVGSVLMNITDFSYAYVVALDSETTLSISDNIFISGKEYGISKQKVGSVIFADAGGDDFHLGSADNFAKGHGADLSSDSEFPFEDDIDDQNRTGTWDIGADEIIGAVDEECSITVSCVVGAEELQNYYEEQQVVVVASCLEEDELYSPGEEGEVVIVAICQVEENIEELQVVAVAVLNEEEVQSYSEEHVITIEILLLEEDYWCEEALIEIVSVIESIDYFYCECVLIVQCEINETDLQDYYDDPSFVIQSIINGIDLQNYYDEKDLILHIITKSLVLENSAPVVKGRNPRPQETCVLRNQKVCFCVCARGVIGTDGVDITTLKVRIGGVEYTYNSQELVYSGDPSGYYVEVDHPDWDFEQVINVEIEAKSLNGFSMDMVAYSFSTEWDENKTRLYVPSIELYEASGNNDLEILTIEEAWVRKDVERFTAELEPWWGKYRKLPYIENLEMRVVAGETNSLGKEILENGYLSIKVEGGDFVKMYQDTVLNFGPMFSHSKKSLFLKLLVPEAAQTERYFILEFEFEPQLVFLYGQYELGKGIYSNAGNTIELAPKRHIYRAYVLSSEDVYNLTMLGISAPSLPFLRSGDKQW